MSTRQTQGGRRRRECFGRACTLIRVVQSRPWSGLRRRTRRLLQDPRAIGTGTLALSGAISALLGVAILPLLTDLYAPDTYAVFAIAAALVSTLCVVVTGRFEQAIPIVCTETETGGEGNGVAHGLARVALITSIVSCLFAQGIVVLLSLLGWLTEGPMRSVLLSLPLLTFLSSLGGIQSMILTGMGRYRTMALHQVLRVFIQLLMQVILGYWQADVRALLLGLAFSLLPSSAHALWMMLPDGMPVAPLLETALQHRHMPIYQIPVTLIRGIEGNAFLFVIAIGYGNELVGFFALASRVLLGPGVILASSVNTVFLYEAVRLSMEGQQRFMRKSFVIMLAVFAAISLATVVLIGPVQQLLGSQWEGATVVILASLPLLGASLVGAVPSSALLIAGLSRVLLAWRTLIMALPCAAILVCGGMGAPGVAAIALAGTTQLILSIVLHYHSLRLISVDPSPA